MIAHTCIKPGCGNRYEDNDPDAYYCPTHLEEKRVIAAELDRKIKPTPKTPSDLELFDSAPKGPRGFIMPGDYQKIFK